MTSVAFLLVAVVLSAIGCAIYLLRHRKPTSLEHGIDSFAREMGALAPGQPGQAGRPTRRRPPPPAARPPAFPPPRGGAERRR